MRTKDGTLYGTTSRGGGPALTNGGYGFNGFGTVFKVSYDGELTTLARFDAIAGHAPCGLIEGDDGNLYGSTADNLFGITPHGKLSTLVSFKGQMDIGGLIQARDGNFYGLSGGILRATKSGQLGFISLPPENGWSPQGGLTQGDDGNLYGTCSDGGPGGATCGTVFRLVLPQIEPIQQIAVAGRTTTLRTVAAAIGSRFKWYHNGKAMAGQSKSNLVIRSAQVSDSGAYTVSISNETGEIGAATASLLVTNPFVGLHGYYEGLAMNASNALDEAPMFFRLKVTPYGAYSGTLISQEGSAVISGSFDANLHATQNIKRIRKTAAALDMSIVPSAGQIQGSIIGDAWTMQLVANHAVSPFTNYLGKYTFILSNTETNGRDGYGFGTLTVSKVGRVTMNARLGDDTTTGGTGYLGNNGQFVIYRSMFGTKGGLFGWGNLAADSKLLWVRPKGPPGGPVGFTNYPTATFFRYVPPPRGSRVIDMPNPLLFFSGADLANPVQSVLNLSSNNQLTVSSTPLKGLAVRLDSASGIFGGTFVHPTTKRSTVFKGVVLQGQTAGWGHFISSQKSGSVYLGHAE